MWLYYHFTSNDGSTWIVHALNVLYAWEKMSLCGATKKDGLRLVGYSLFDIGGYIYPMTAPQPEWLK